MGYLRLWQLTKYSHGCSIKVICVFSKEFLKICRDMLIIVVESVLGGKIIEDWCTPPWIVFAGCLNGKWMESKDLQLLYLNLILDRYGDSPLQTFYYFSQSPTHWTYLTNFNILSRFSKSRKFDYYFHVTSVMVSLKLFNIDKARSFVEQMVCVPTKVFENLWHLNWFKYGQKILRQQLIDTWPFHVWQ